MKTKTSYDKKQNVGMIALFIFSITLTAGLTAKLTKKANDNANKINQVNDDLTKLDNLVKQDKAKLLFEAIPGSENDTSASIDLPLSIIDDYSMIFVETRVDEFAIQEYYLTKVLSKSETLNYYMGNGDRCGAADQNTLAGAIVYFTPSVENDTLNLTIDEVFFDTFDYKYVNGHFCEYKEDGSLKAYDPRDSGIAWFSNIYGIK